jgi:hypothetical protein
MLKKPNFAHVRPDQGIYHTRSCVHATCAGVHKENKKVEFMNPPRVYDHEAQCQADGYFEPRSASESPARRHPPHIYIHDDGHKVHVHVMHHNAEPELHIYDFGDPAIFAHVDDYYGAGDPANGTS